VQPIVVPGSEVRDGLATCTRIAEDRERNPLRPAARDLQHLHDLFGLHGDHGRTARGIRYLEVDASSESRPILERLGFDAVTTTTPYIWSPG
jgi:hypothetical protein